MPVVSSGRHPAIEHAAAQFNEWADHYDTGIWSHYFARGYRRAAMLLQNGLPENPAILDLGCGTGGLARVLLERHPSAKVFGVDLSPRMIEQCQHRASLADFIVGEASRLPYRDDVFDAVTCLNSFHHYPDALSVLQEVNRCLKPGGVFLLLDPVRDGRVRQMWATILQRIFDEPYAKYYTSEEIADLLRTANLITLNSEYFLHVTKFTVASSAMIIEAQ